MEWDDGGFAGLHGVVDDGCFDGMDVEMRIGFWWSGCRDKGGGGIRRVFDALIFEIWTQGMGLL